MEESYRLDRIESCLGAIASRIKELEEKVESKICFDCPVAACPKSYGSKSHLVRHVKDCAERRSKRDQFSKEHEKEWEKMKPNGRTAATRPGDGLQSQTAGRSNDQPPRTLRSGPSSSYDRGTPQIPQAYDMGQGLYYSAPAEFTQDFTNLPDVGTWGANTQNLAAPSFSGADNYMPHGSMSFDNGNWGV